MDEVSAVFESVERFIIYAHIKLIIKSAISYEYFMLDLWLRHALGIVG
jgi:hypothetical protein